ncbi:TPA: hypothetical protein DCW38_07940 [candidate division WOR-3 bacterium]|jgi:mannose/fructose-specific phosphotransferase system component IIA|uniref:PTS EIIA type-4 domain-containing protein n=1 Tax=candidate division WOR-3 bacterium TaxID=2052148 RepID=A0A350HC26_UNCW3|nr:hypothetical protein [candidate division WOR-3 bacterium]
MIYGIFAGHSNFASNAVESAEKIIGTQDNYSIISNKDLSSEEIFGLLEEIINKNAKDTHFFIFIDFYGSSISLPSVRIKQMHDSRVNLLFGYNMPMILDFFIHRTNKSPFELSGKLIEVGRMGIR